MVAKSGGAKKSSSKSSGGTSSSRSGKTGMLVGRTKDGVSIVGPKYRSRHFTKKQARDALAVAHG
jgi:hypothetical protein